MNGANHVGELITQREIECPCCTKKLLHSFGWDLEERYQAMAKAATHVGLEDMAEVLSGHILPCFQRGMSASTAGAVRPKTIKQKYQL